MFDSAYRVIKSYERRIRRKLKGQVRGGLPADFDQAFLSIHDACKDFTMTGPMRMHALYEAVKYIVSAKIDGDIVECGVWRGGSAMVAAMTLMHLGDTSRDIWLYDTYEGMSQPSEKDVTVDGRKAMDRWRKDQQHGGANEWCFASLEDVRRNLLRTGYPERRLHFVQGKVEETIPNQAPQSISILRLDTDWYESTYHEFVHLYPRLGVGGTLILDDYGAWKGAREATDKYLNERGIKLFLNRIDEVSRMAIKTYS